MSTTWASQENMYNWAMRHHGTNAGVGESKPGMFLCFWEFEANSFSLVQCNAVTFRNKCLFYEY